MSREFSQQELQAVMQAEAQLREQGLIVDNDDGKEAADHNSERISAFFELNTHISVSVESVLAAVQQMRDQMRFKPQEQVQFERLFNILGQDEQRAYKAFRQSGLIDDHHNGAMLLGFLAGRKMHVDHSNLVYALKGIAPQLHWEEREQVSSGRPGHTSDGKGLFSKSDTNLSARDHQKLSAEAAAKASGKPTPAQGTDYRALADSVQGSTHSKTEQIQKMFTTRPGTSDIDYEQTYYARRRAAGL